MHLDSMWLLSELSIELDQHCRSEISLGEPLHGLCSLRPLPYYAMRRLVQTDVRRSDARVSLVPQMHACHSCRRCFAQRRTQAMHVRHSCRRCRRNPYFRPATQLLEANSMHTRPKTLRQRKCEGGWRYRLTLEAATISAI
jgi:hypothetical protein